jgi:hypothetical protein
MRCTLSALSLSVAILLSGLSEEMRLAKVSGDVSVARNRTGRMRGVSKRSESGEGGDVL